MTRDLRSTRIGHRLVSAWLALAVLVFAPTCALHAGTACAVDAGALGGHAFAGAAQDRSDCCANPHACGHARSAGTRPERGSPTALCCSTWAPASAPVRLATPPALVLVLPPAVASPGDSPALAARPEPTPSESPPPLRTVLRL